MCLEIFCFELALRRISNCFRISSNVVHQALKRIRVNGSENDTLAKERPRKATPQLDRTVHRLSEVDQFQIADDIRYEISIQINT